MAYFFTNNFKTALVANQALMDSQSFKIVLFRFSPTLGSIDPSWRTARTVAELTAMPGWVEVTGPPTGISGYPLTNTMPTSTRTLGGSRYVMYNPYPFTALSTSTEVRAIGIVAAGAAIGGISSALIFVTNTPLNGVVTNIDPSDALTSAPDSTFTDATNRWLFSWATTAPDPVEGALVIALGSPEFEVSGSQHAWLYPQRANMISNPSFEAVGTDYWSANQTITRVSGAAPGAGAWSGSCAGTGGKVIMESNIWSTQLGEKFNENWSVQVKAKGTGQLKVGLVYWDASGSTRADWGEETWDLLPDAWTHVAVHRHLPDAHLAMLRLECVGTGLTIDQVLAEPGFLKDWLYFDGDEKYGARDDFSWYGGYNKAGASYSLWYNHRKAVVGRLFARTVDPNDPTQNVTDEDMEEQGLVYRWVPAGITVIPHMDCFYAFDVRNPVPIKPAGVLPYWSAGTPTGVPSPWESSTPVVSLTDRIDTLVAVVSATAPLVVSLTDRIDTLVAVVSATAPTCTDVLREPFDNLAAWTNLSGASIVAGRTGTGAQLNGTGNATFTIPALSESADLTVGFAHRITALPATRLICQLCSDASASNHITLQIKADGALQVQRGGTAGTVIGTSATGLIVVNTWAYIEIQATLHDTAGKAIVRVNGSTVLNLTGIDTKNVGTKTVFDTLQIQNGGAGAINTIDDLYITTGAGCAFQGDQTIVAAGSTNVLLEPFNDFTTNGWADYDSSFVIVAARTGNGARGTGGANSCRYRIPSIAQSATIVVGFAYRVSNATGTRAMFRLESDSGASSHVYVQVLTTGAVEVRLSGAAGTLLAATGASKIPINTYVYVELKAFLHDTLGTVELHVNGTLEASATNVDTKYVGTKTVFDAVCLLSPASGINNIFDDLYITTGAGAVFHGDITIP